MSNEEQEARRRVYKWLKFTHAEIEMGINFPTTPKKFGDLVSVYTLPNKKSPYKTAKDLRNDLRIGEFALGRSRQKGWEVWYANDEVLRDYREWLRIKAY